MWGNMGITLFIHNFGAVWRSMILTLQLFYPKRNSTHFIQGCVGRPDNVNTLETNICRDRMLIHCLITLYLVTANWSIHCLSLTAHCLVIADWSTHCLSLAAHCLIYWLNHSFQPNDPMFSISSMKFANGVFFEFVRFCSGQLWQLQVEYYLTDSL